jgi:RNA-directed DNA polymerase
VLEADITACFDEIDHAALLGRLRRRVGDKRVLALVKAFLKAGILAEDGAVTDTITGTPQGGILSPLLSNLALSVLDEHFAKAWQAVGSTSSARQWHRGKGLATWRLVRYADDFVVLVAGSQAHAQALREEVAAVLAPMGLRLSEHKTRITHIDEGFDFLGFRIQRHPKRGTAKRYVYTYPARKALAAVKAKLRALSRQDRNQPLAVLLHRLNLVLRGWTSYFKHGVSKRTFSYLRAFVWRRVACWLRRKHPHASWRWLRRHYLPRWWPTDGEVTLVDPSAVAVTRYRYRAARIPSPWTEPARQRVNDTR